MRLHEDSDNLYVLDSTRKPQGLEFTPPHFVRDTRKVRDGRSVCWSTESPFILLSQCTSAFSHQVEYTLLPVLLVLEILKGYDDGLTVDGKPFGSGYIVHSAYGSKMVDIYVNKVFVERMRDLL
jgi:hypothetical protein